MRYSLIIIGALLAALGGPTAADLARRARETQAIPSPAAGEIGAARGPFADLSETHSLTHPCHATADYVSDLLERGRLVDTMNASSNLNAVDRSRANIAWLRALTHEYGAERKLSGKTSRQGSQERKGQ